MEGAVLRNPTAPKIPALKRNRPDEVDKQTIHNSVVIRSTQEIESENDIDFSVDAIFRIYFDPISILYRFSISLVEMRTPIYNSLIANTLPVYVIVIEICEPIFQYVGLDEHR